jgi:hypothetical protein
VISPGVPNAGAVCLNKPEITPPPNSNHFPDGTAQGRHDMLADGALGAPALDDL